MKKLKKLFLKKCLPIMLSVAMTVSSIPMTAFADTVIETEAHEHDESCGITEPDGTGADVDQTFEATTEETTTVEAVVDPTTEQSTEDIESEGEEPKNDGELSTEDIEAAGTTEASTEESTEGSTDVSTEAGDTTAAPSESAVESSAVETTVAATTAAETTAPAGSTLSAEELAALQAYETMWDAMEDLLADQLGSKSLTKAEIEAEVAEMSEEELQDAREAIEALYELAKEELSSKAFKKFKSEAEALAWFDKAVEEAEKAVVTYSETYLQILEDIESYMEKYGLTPGMSEDDIYDAIDRLVEEGLLEESWAELSEIGSEVGEVPAKDEALLKEDERVQTIRLYFATLASFDQMTYASKTVTVLDGKITVSDTSGNCSVADNVVKTSTYSWCVLWQVSQGTNNVTIANTSDSKAVITFDYKAYKDGNGTCAFSEGSNGSKTLTLDIGESVTYILTANAKSERTSQVTGYLELSNFTFVPVVDAKVTFDYNETFGSITVNNESIEPGTVCEIPAEGKTITAIPNNGVEFLGWVDTAANNRIISTDSTYLYSTAENTSVKAIFIDDNSEAHFALGTLAEQKYKDASGAGSLVAPTITYYVVNKTHLFEDFDSAAAEASNNTASKTMVLLNDATLAGDHTIPSGVTLLIPFDDANTLYKKEAQSTGGYVTPSAYRTLTLAEGATLTINGELSVSAKHKYANAGAGNGSTPTGKVGWIEMEDGSSITINKGGTLYAYGYVTGSGNIEESGIITVKSGGNVYEYFQFMDFRGGTATTEIKNKVFPLSQYYVQNVEVPMTYEMGANEYSYTTIYMSSSAFGSSVKFIGAKGSGAMFELSSGSATKYYDGSTDRLIVMADGDMSLSPIEMKVATDSMNSSNYVLPITNNLTIEIKEGSNVSLAQDVAFLPGSKIIVHKDAVCTVAKGVNVYIYDADEWSTYCYGGNTSKSGLDAEFWPLDYAPGRKTTRTEADLVDASILVNGYVDASEGNIYTTKGGANIYSTNEEPGKVNLRPGAEGATTYQYRQSAETYDSIPITSAKLKNSEENSYVDTSISSAVLEYYYENGRWTIDCEELQSHQWITLEINPKPTCTETGVKKLECYFCGKTETEVVEALGHTEETIPAVPATCTEDGLTQGSKCTVCGEITVKQVVAPSPGHTEEALAAVAPTCTKTGLEAGTKCKVCNDVLVTQKEIPATGHSEVDVLGTDATCETPGKTAGKKCSVCGEFTVEQQPINALGHSNEAVVTAPTCTEKGYTTYTCSVCGKVEVKDEVTAKGHSYSETITTAPDCTNKGLKTFTCTVCGDSYPEAIDALGHTFDEGSVTAPTCTKKGYTTYTCTVCGETEVKDEVAANGHSYNTVITAPTCTEAGYTTYTCTVCGDIYVDDEVSATGHSYEAVVTAPSCTEGGYTTHTCSVCGHSYVDEKTNVVDHDTKVLVPGKAATCTSSGLTNGAKCSMCGETQVSQETISATGHSHIATVIAPTCTEEGYTTNVCSSCGDSYTSNPVSAKGHRYGAVVTAPSCTEGGYTTYTCGVCGDSYVADETSATGHSYEAVVTAPTCTEGGYTTYTCSGCGDSYVEDEVSANGHSYEAVVTIPTCTEGGYTTYTCSGCADSYVEDEVSANGHSYNEEVNSPSCEKAGEATYTCNVCGYEKSEILKATGHSYEAVVTAPTCKKQGYTTYTCKNINCETKSYVADFVPATGHSWGEWLVTTEPTCLEAGEETRTCKSGCTETRVKEATGHSWGEWLVTVEPTCLKAGEETRTCEKGCTESRVKDATGHSYEAVVTKPTCTVSGFTTYTCGGCGDSYTDDLTNALGHGWGSWEEMTPASCTKDGEQVRICIRGCEERETIPAKGHIMGDWVVTTPATCTELGEETRTCTHGCGASEKQPTADKAPHVTSYSPVKAETCTKDGYGYIVCENCDLEERYTIPAGHLWENIEAQPATCENAGILAGKECTRCHEYVAADENAEPTPALGHAWDEGVETKSPTCTEVGELLKTCSRCGATTTETIDASGHDYKSVETEPTCTVGGYTTYTCSNCGDNYKGAYVNANGHAYSDFVETSKATCYAAGEKVRTCSVCGDEDKQIIEKRTHRYTSVTTDPTCTMPGYTTHTCEYPDCGDSYVSDEFEANGHAYESVVTEPTCTEGGYTTNTCSVCGDSYISDETEANGHNYNFVVAKNPTCTENGRKTGTCSVCGDMISETIPMKGHEYNAVVTEPTCTTDGYTTNTCSVCGDVYISDEIEAEGHNYESVVTNPTCTTGGYTINTCSVCGDTYVSDEKDELGHKWNAGEVTTAPTCTETGVTTFTCTNGTCGETYTSVIDAKGHNYESVVTEPTCTADGYTTNTCSACGDSYKSNYVDKTVHKYETNRISNVKVSEATCTDGATYYRQCDNCDYVNTKMIVEVGDALGHTTVINTPVAPTCTTTGLDEGSYCSACGTVFKVQTVLDALGHNYSSVITAPTCTEGGYTTNTCTNGTCGDTQISDHRDALGHEYDNGEITTAPTCTEDGVKTFTCKRTGCEDSYSEIEAKTGHTYNTVVTAPTCESDGYTTYTCKNNCGLTYEADIVEKVGHEWKTGEITTPATCTEDGVKTFTCINDETHTKTEVITASGHIYRGMFDSRVEATPATCTEKATHYVKCDNCDHVNYELTVSVGNPNGHSYANNVDSGVVASAATCTAAATHYVKCDVETCNELNKTKTIVVGEPNGHSYVNTVDSMIVASVATCTEAEKHYVKCDVENCSFVNEELTVAYGEPKGHSYVTKIDSGVIASEMTCTTAEQHYVKCDVATCNEINKEITIAFGAARGHSYELMLDSGVVARAASCTTAATHYVKCDVENCIELNKTLTIVVGEAKGHTFENLIDSNVIVSRATCVDPEMHKVQCDNCNVTSNELTVPVGDALGHVWDKGVVTEEPICTIPGERTHTCMRLNCGVTEVKEEPALGHDVEQIEAKLPTYGSAGWNAHEKCKRCAYTTAVEIPMLEKGIVKDFNTFMENLKLLEEWAVEYAKKNPGKDPLDLLIKYIRTGVDRYNSGSWGIMAGYEDKGFAQYVLDKEEEINLAKDNTDDMIAVSRLKDLGNFNLPNGDYTDIGHMFGTMDITYNNNFGENHADVAGWGGDLVDLLSLADQFGVKATEIEDMVKEVKAKYFLEFESNFPEKPIEGSFSMTDFYGDLDGLYVMKELEKIDEYELGDLYNLLDAYFTTELTNEQRALYYINNRIGGVTNRGGIRKAVFEEYTSNKVIGTLEGTREFNTKDLSDLRRACCYAFADYIWELAGDYVEYERSEYLNVFEESYATLAPGITQEIKKATTIDGKQLVYYTATADINSEYINVYANYNENDPSQGWAMSRVEDQMAAAQERHGNPASDEYIPNYNVIAGINGAGFNMSTGEPGGVLVMNGVEWHEPNGDGFFGIMKDGTAKIGSTAYYNAHKDEVQEAIAGFSTMLIRDGKIVDNLDANVNSRASRTAIGITRTGKVVFMVADGRQEPVSCGANMREIAQILLEAGCVEAVNLDGGGSSTYVAKQEGADTPEVINRPSDGFARSVSTSLMIVSTAPSDTEFDHAMITSDRNYLTIGSTVQLTATGVSATGNTAELPEGTTWEVAEESRGSVTEDGVFTGKDLGDVTVRLMLGDDILATRTLHVVIPDTVYFKREKMDAIYGTPIELPVAALYDGKNVAVNVDDFVFTVSNAGAGTFEGYNFTATEGTGLKNVTVTAKLAADKTLSGSMVVYLYNQGEATFDFEKATGGDRMFAWDRQVSNSTTEDNLTYKVVNPTEPMTTSYIFAIDMTQIPIPEILSDLIYMLPGSDAADASAWNFLLQLAERISVLTEVRPVVKFDPRFDVDYSELNVMNEYFIYDPNKVTFDPETNELTMILNWKDQTQAIDPQTANPMCILSGIKLTPKADADWGPKDKMEVVNSGTIGYDIYLRANALYTFSCDEANRAKYGIEPFINPDLPSEKGGKFGDVYKEFADTYTLINTLNSGWVYEDGGYAYYEDGVRYTGLQEINGFYYDFGEDGINIGQTKFTGLFEIDGVNHYAKDGKLVTGWQKIGEEKYYFGENGAALDGKHVIDEVEVQLMNGKLVGGMTGFVTKKDGNTYYIVGGEMVYGWYYIGEDLYHFNVTTGVATTGTKIAPDDESRSKKAYYDIENGKVLRGYFNPDGFYYWGGVSKKDAWVKNGHDADPDAWYATNMYGVHIQDRTSTEETVLHYMDGILYTFENATGKLVKGSVETKDGLKYYYWAGEPRNDGWFTIFGETYYAYADGHLATGTVVIDGKNERFDSNGLYLGAGTSGGSSSGGGGGSSSGGGGGSSSGGGGGGSSSGGGGGSSSGKGTGPASSKLPSYVVSGNWVKVEDGKQVTGTAVGTTTADDNWKFIDSNGNAYVNKWAAVHNPYANTAAGQSNFDWFYFDGNGNMVTGWIEYENNKYYLHPISDGTLGRMYTGWNEIDGKWYYMNPNSDGTRGAVVTDAWVDGYYLGADGVRVEGATRPNTNASTSLGVTQLPEYVVGGSWSQNKSNDWMFTDSNGVPYSSRWAAVHNPYANTAAGQSDFDWFYFNEKGIMQTGWLLSGGLWYYLNPVSDGTLGRMFTGWQQIAGKWYYLNPESDGTKGAKQTNKWIGDKYVDSDGVLDESKKRQ